MAQKMSHSTAYPIQHFPNPNYSFRNLPVHKKQHGPVYTVITHVEKKASPGKWAVSHWHSSSLSQH